MFAMMILLAVGWLTGQVIAAPTRTLFDDPCLGLRCEDFGQEPFYSVVSKSCYCGTMADWYKEEDEALSKLQDRGAAPIPEPSFIPPPKKDITPELIQQALTAQPQNTAVISSIVPFFLDGVIRVYLQLAGAVPYTLVVNASTSLPCGAIGLGDPQPDVALVPLVMNQGQGQPQTVVANCECIAVNMYIPYEINYWVQDLSNGNVYSVAANNLVRDIDKMNTTQSAALALTVLMPGSGKRGVGDAVEYIRPEKRQIWRVNCNYACPLYHMTKVNGTDGSCACLLKGADENFVKRDLIQPDMMNAKMTAEACAAMTCFNNGGNPTPALWHPLLETCWCITQPRIESNPNAWKPSS